VTQLERWLENLQQNQFNGTNNVRINYAVMSQPLPSPAMIICNGRIESYLKYSELATELFELGYSVYMLDHRGQGLSQRLAQDPHLGHVDDFNHYINDFELFINQVVLVNNHNAHYIVSHSMGGAIAARYIQTCDHPIDKLVLASPMFGIVLPMPVPAVRLVTKLASYYAAKVSHEPSYVLGGQPYSVQPFAGNCLTQSPARYQEFRHVYQQFPQIQLGAPSNQWLTEAMTAADLCIEQASQINIPTLLLQASSDTVVANVDQKVFVIGMDPQLIEFVVIADARHELFFERDDYRQPTLAAITQFFDPSGSLKI
jgi:lysophospholipase